MTTITTVKKDAFVASIKEAMRLLAKGDYDGAITIGEELEECLKQANNISKILLIAKEAKNITADGLDIGKELEKTAKKLGVSHPAIAPTPTPPTPTPTTATTTTTTAATAEVPAPATPVVAQPNTSTVTPEPEKELSVWGKIGRFIVPQKEKNEEVD